MKPEIIPSYFLKSKEIYIIHVDLDGFITYASPHFLEKFNFLSDNIVGLSSIETVYKEDRSKCHQTVLACFAQPETPIGVVLRKPYYDNSFIWTQWEFTLQLDENRQPDHIVCMGYDITHAEELSKQAIAMLDMLIENEEKYRDLFELSPVGIALTSEDGKFIEVNEAMSIMTGYSQNELLSRTYWDLTPTWYNEMEKKKLESLGKTGVYGPYEKEYIAHDGTLIPVLLHGRIFYNKLKRPFVWSIIQDMRAIKQKEAIILEQNKAFKDIAFTQSHIIRHPLTNIMGLLSLIDEKDVPDHVKNILNLMQESANQLDQVIKEVVDKTVKITL